MDSPILINSQAESSCDSLDRRRLVTFRLLTLLAKEKREDAIEFAISSRKHSLARSMGFELAFCNSLSLSSLKTV